MNKTELITAAAEAAGVSKKDAKAVLEAAFDTITKAITGGDKVQLVGFGTFEAQMRGERTGRNPRTGDPYTIAAHKAPVFKAGKALKEAVNQ